MQNAKDTFYMTLRGRLSQINPSRVMLMRGSTRPSILVADAEAPVRELPLNTFVLRWKGMNRVSGPVLPVVRLMCEVSYSTLGSTGFGGLDRGRKLTEMDDELLQMLAPLSTPKMDYSTSPASTLKTAIFWSEPEFGDTVCSNDAVSRTAKVAVYSYEEPSE